MAISSTNLVDALRQHRLLPPAQLQELDRLLAKFTEPPLLAKQLLQRGWLTSYQVNFLLLGRGSELVLGPYRILERLGEGGNGQVFKACHQAMNRVVALKRLRQELLGDEEAVGRFYREIEVLSQISHPNIVHAYDAGPIGSSLVLAMEFIDGTDLDRLVKDTGPLPVLQACDCIRQAAQGLQHAHEKGLIHRDIKPSNLLVAQGHGAQSVSWGTVKILDLGLARLQQPMLGSRTTNLTMLGGSSMMQGTPDYMSPEQALDFHSADSRSDIYSLGCTFYFLLTGQPPFPAGSLTQKLLGHQQAEPLALEQLRQRLAPELLAVLRKMLAKQPQDRQQTPGAVAQALAALQGKEQETRAGAALETLTEAKPGERASARASWLLSSKVGGRGDGKVRRRGVFWFAGFLLVLLAISAPILFFRSGMAPRQGADNVPSSQRASGQDGAHPDLVAVASVSTGKRYDTALAKVGVVYWIDREYKITAISRGLEGGILIRGANSDKNVVSPVHLLMTLSAPATVYVAYDKRGTKLPAWLSDGTWHLTGETLSASGGDVDASPMKVYAKGFSTGRLALGGNRQAPASGADSNYVVIVKASPG